MQDLFSITAISPIDGRYHKKTAELSKYFSEFSLIKYRLWVEIRWFLFLSQREEIKELPRFSENTQKFLESLYEDFGIDEALEIKSIEKTTNHDVKAVEYFIKKHLASNEDLAPFQEFVHFACTSEDINNLAHALVISKGLHDTVLPQIHQISAHMKQMIKQFSAQPMLARTHGQAASPTTLGKEVANTFYRLKRQIQAICAVQILGKINGAVGNYNAHFIAYPEVDWESLGREFVQSLGIAYNPYTTQIEPHDYMAELFDAFSRFNTILIDFCRDVWSYISIGYFDQNTVAGEVGSSTMPHKVNPIDFENAEGNFGLANAVFQHLSQKLPISRWQRDLTDSTVIRNLGVCFGYSFIALQSLEQGLKKITPNKARLQVDLDSAWEVLAEPIQTLMRKHGVSEPYEKLKAFTRGKTVDETAIKAFIVTLDLPFNVREVLLALTPQNYLGNAAQKAAALGGSPEE